MISKLMRIPLALLYLKYPRVCKYYFIFEMFINTQEAFLHYNANALIREYHIELIYLNLLVNYIILCLFDVAKNFIAIAIYVSAMIYAQSIFYPEESIGTIMYWNLPNAILTCMLNFLASCIMGEFFLSRIEKWNIEHGHLQFIDNFKEGLVIIPENQQKIKIMNKAARNIFRLPDTEADNFFDRM